MIRTADWRALGTGVRLVVHDGDLGAAQIAVDAILREVDATYSRFRPDSELVAVNAAAGRTTPVSPLLGRAIEGSLAAARRSGGAVDPTVGRALRAIGYDADFDSLAAAPAGRAIELRLVPVPGWEAVVLDPTRGTVRLRHGVQLDLGSTGKGLAADLAAAAALDAAGTDSGVLVSLGGDIATAGRAPGGGWRIRLADDSRADPETADDPGRTVTIASGAIATSSITVRRWRAADGVTIHHIVDPRTGLPADTPWRTVTVAAATAEEANGASTAAIVLGSGARAWLERTGLPARLVAGDGAVAWVNGWPMPETAGSLVA